jgi:hypothetical protein
MADRLKGRGTAMTGKTGRLPRRTSLGAYLGGEEAAAAEYAYQRLQEAFARPLPLPRRDVRFGYDNAGATHDEQPHRADEDVGGLLRDYFARHSGAAPKHSRLGSSPGEPDPAYLGSRLQGAFAEPIAPILYQVPSIAGQPQSDVRTDYRRMEYDRHTDDSGPLGKMLGTSSTTSTRYNPQWLSETLLAARREIESGAAGTGHASVYHPSWRERLTYAMLDGLMGLGADLHTARHYADGTTGLLEEGPIGVATAVNDAQRALDRGDYLGAAVAALGAVPIFRKGKKPLREAAEGVETAIARWQPTLFEPVERRADIPQRALPRYEPPRGVPPRILDAVNNPTVRRKIAESAQHGLDMIGTGWSNTEPLRIEYIKEWNDNDKADQLYRLLVNFSAAASPVSDVGTSIRNGSYYVDRFVNGDGVPEIGSFNPPPYGHPYQHQHQSNVRQVLDGGLEPLRFPKTSSYGENLFGNVLPIAADSNTMRMLGILADDARFLKTSLKLPDGTCINPRAMVERGEMSIEEAAKHPTMWHSQPRPNEYGAVEKLFQDISRREFGLHPADMHAGAWVGNADLTGLRSNPYLPWLGHLEDHIYRTEQKLQIPAKEVLRRLVLAKSPIIALAAIAAGANAIDRLPDRDDKSDGQHRSDRRQPNT